MGKWNLTAIGGGFASSPRGNSADDSGAVAQRGQRHQFAQPHAPAFVAFALQVAMFDRQFDRRGDSQSQGPGFDRAAEVEPVWR